MAVARSHQFNPNLDPELLRSIEAAAAAYKPYRAELRSGYRPGDKRQHGRGEALDIQLYDPKTGAALDSYQSGGAISPYQQFANSWYQSLTPEQQAKARWGGYFGDPNSADYGTKYGNQDYMHFDFGRTPELGMLAGDWNTGFNAGAQKKLGLSAGGGIEAIDAQMKAAGYTPEQRRNAIASIESAGSGDYAARGREADPAGHRGLGRYQVMDYNVAPWAEQYLKQSGVTTDQFMKDPALQDKLFDAVYGDYVKQYGERGAASKWFTGSEKEPPTTDANGKLTGKSYADKYMAALGGTPTAQHPPNPTVGTGGFVKPGADTTQVPAATATPWWKKLGESIGKGGMAMAGGGGLDMPNRPALSSVPARIDEGDTPTIDPRQQDMQRQMLAEAMARLNSGKLYG